MMKQLESYLYILTEIIYEVKPQHSEILAVIHKRSDFKTADLP